MSFLKFLSPGLLFLLYSLHAQTQTIDSLRQKIERIIDNRKADVGVCISGIENKDSLALQGNRHFPLQSVFKLHIALAVLHQIDKGKYSLDQKMYLTKKDLSLKTWSPLRDKYPEGNVWVTLTEILNYTVSQSDNNGCDFLLRLIGGVSPVNDYIHQIGVRDFSIQVNEEEMQKVWDSQFKNWTTPAGAVKLLKIFYAGKILSEKTYEFIWNAMTESPTGPNRIKGQLPAGTLVAHKTGTSGTNEKGVTGAINDMGIVALPNGKHYAIAVFVSNSKENTEINEKIISDISKLAWDYFSNRKE
ncbi:MAG: class A beta-lactamase, subclass A2 [Bacteroidota bacterium]|nr:class A beta-lactamase, subclass A2 [Bacteroidota bacterium]